MLLHYFVILGTLYLSSALEKKIVCYWNSDSDKHIGLQGYFRASDIDPALCTHIIYKNIYFSPSSFALFWSPQNTDKSGEFLAIKSRNPSVKLLIGVGGPGWGATNPSNITSNPTGQENLARAIKSFLDSHPGFDGVDFDWQWPGDSGYANDKQNHASFLAALRRVITFQKILSVSVAPRNEDIEKSYNIPAFIDHVDFINLNAFDLRGYRTDTATAFHAPYRKNQSDRNPEAEWNAVSIVSSWKTRNVPTEKLTLGIPTYGRSFTLLDTADNGVDSPISGLGIAGSFAPQTNARQKNVIPYAEICYNLNQEGTTWESVWSNTHFTPYATYDYDQWVGYDDETSVLAKIHLVLDNDFAGINYAALDYDDFSGLCSSVKFPLIKLGYDAVINGIFAPNPVEPTTTTPRPGEPPVITTTEIGEPSVTTEEPMITTIPITETPSTENPTTESPSTEIPSTENPTTESPSTEAPSTEAPSTEAPSTEAPSTEAPSTEAPSTENPTTEPETSPESSSSTTSSTTLSKTTTTRTTTSEIPTPPVTPGLSTYKPSEISTTITSTPSLADLTKTSELTTEPISTQTKTSTSTTDFKTPPVTPTTSLSKATTEQDNITDPTEEDNTAETSTLSSLITEGDSNEDLIGSTTDETTNDDFNTEETTNGDGAAGIPNDSTTGLPNSTDDITQDILDSTTLSSLISTEEPDITAASSSVITEESTASNGQTTESSTTSKKSTAIPSNFSCPQADGNFKNPIDCTSFFICSNWYPYLFECQPGLYYDEVNDRCDYQSAVECNVN